MPLGDTTHEGYPLARLDFPSIGGAYPDVPYIRVTFRPSPAASGLRGAIRRAIPGLSRRQALAADTRCWSISTSAAPELLELLVRHRADDVLPRRPLAVLGRLADQELARRAKPYLDDVVVRPTAAGAAYVARHAAAAA